MHGFRKTISSLTSLLMVAAVSALGGEQRAKKPVDVPAFVSKLADLDDLVRRSALAALRRAGQAAKTAFPKITELLKGKDAIVRIYAASALHEIDPQSELALPVLLAALRTKDETARCYAAVSFRGYDPAAVPALIELFRDKDPRVHM
jgi:HEAT repeat protein